MGYSVHDHIGDVLADEVVYYWGDQAEFGDEYCNGEFFNDDVDIQAVQDRINACHVLTGIDSFYVFNDGWFHWSCYQAMAHAEGEPTTSP